MNWEKYKEYLYANLRPNTARLALKYGKKYSHVLQRMDVKDLLILQPAKGILRKTETEREEY